MATPMTEEEFEQGAWEEIHRAENMDFSQGEYMSDPRDYIDPIVGVDLYEEMN